jgi:hypothetical protein
VHFVSHTATQNSVSRPIQESAAQTGGQLLAMVDLPARFAGVWTERLSGQQTLFKVTARPVRLLFLKYENKLDDRGVNVQR